MKKSMKWLSLLLALVLVVGCFAACGKNDVDDAAKTAAVKVVDVDLTNETYAFGVDKNQPELLEQVNAFIKEIMQNGKFDEICNKYFADGTPAVITSAKLDPSKDQLVVATNAAFEPFEYTVGDNFSGIDMEIAALLAEKLGKELVIQNMEFEAVCLSVGQQKCDIAMAGLTVSEDRKEYVNFSDSYYTASQRLIVKGDNTEFDACKTAEDVENILKAKDKTTKIGVQNGTTAQFYLQGDEELEFAGFSVECVPYKNGSMAVQDMLNGGIQYVVIDAAPAARIAAAINELN